MPASGRSEGYGQAGINGRLGVRGFAAAAERCPHTGLLVGYVPGFPKAHTQATSLDELHRDLEEVIAVLLQDGKPTRETELVGVRTVKVA